MDPEKNGQSSLPPRSDVLFTNQQTVQPSVSGAEESKPSDAQTSPSFSPPKPDVASPNESSDPTDNVNDNAARNRGLLVLSIIIVVVLLILILSSTPGLLIFGL